MKNLATVKEFNPVTTKVKMIKSWTPEQFKAIEKSIAKHFRGKTLNYYNGSNGHQIKPFGFIYIDQFLGLAYTSSGIFACYGICNVSAYFDADNIYQYSYFTIGEDGKHYAILQDTGENELCIEL